MLLQSNDSQICPNLEKDKYFFNFTMKKQYKEAKLKTLIFSHYFKTNWVSRG